MAEITVTWDQFNAIDKKAICSNYAMSLKLPADKLLQIFDTARVTVVLGQDKTGCYCRLTPESKEVVMVIIKNCKV